MSYRKVNPGETLLITIQLVNDIEDQFPQTKIYDSAGALVTGESLAQVSSQTLPNLALIDGITDHLVIRPLIVMDKLDIID